MRLKQSTIAKELGITEGRVSQLKRDGMPTESLSEAVAWYRERIDQKYSPKPIPGVLMPSQSIVSSLIEEGYDIQRARAKREHHEANLAELRERQALGELVEAAQIQRAATTLAAMTRSAFEKIPDKLAERLAVEADANLCHAMLTAEIDLVLADLAAGARTLTEAEPNGRH
jgi:predicted transcriptional regulator